MGPELTIMWPAKLPYRELTLFPSVHADPFMDGGDVFLRLNVAHRAEGCNWSCSFPGAPSSVVTWDQLIAEINNHMNDCPRVGPKE